MKNLFLIDGASGTGKSDLLRYVTEFELDGISMPKYTTRIKRPYEEERNLHLDLNCVNEEEFKSLNLDFKYKYGGNKYGFLKDDLDDYLKSSNNVFLIVRDSDLIKKLIKIYSYINVIPIYIYTDQNLIIERLKKEEYKVDQIQYRIEKVKNAFRDYLNNPYLYDDLLINNSSYDNYINLIRSLIKKHEESQKIEPDLIFVLMSFNTSNPKLIDNYKAIKRSIDSLDGNYRCLRLDESPGSYKISETSKEFIRKCRLAIFDLTENKQNVYYELGFAQGISKECILVAQKGTEVQFYSNEYKILYYESVTELQSKLEKQIQSILKNE